MGTQRCSRAMVATALVAFGAVTGLGERLGAQEGACSQPYAPVATYSSLPGRQSVVELDAPEVPVEAMGSTTELRGGELLPSVDPQEVVVARATGELRLRAGTEEVWGLSAGDLDDDGIDEIWVGNWVVGFVVPGTTPDGAHEASVVGIRVGGGPALARLGGYFGDDVFARSVPSDGPLDADTTQVVSATALLATGPGGDASGLPLLDEAPGSPVARIGFDEPQYLFGRYLVEFGGQARIYSLSADGTETAQFRGEILSTPAIAVQGPGGRYFGIRNEDDFRIMNVWSYDAPCTSLRVFGTSPMGPWPAEPTEPAAPAGPTGPPVTAAPPASAAAATALRFTG